MSYPAVSVVDPTPEIITRFDAVLSGDGSLSPHLYLLDVMPPEKTSCHYLGKESEKRVPGLLKKNGLMNIPPLLQKLG